MQRKTKMDTKWELLSVKEIIEKIKNTEFVLPVIQRRLVWDKEQMELLFDSLLKKNSTFGAIICIKENKDSKSLFAWREFASDGNNRPSSQLEEITQTHYLVVDGQQRLQSLYIGTQGTFEGQHMYFDLFSDYLKEEYDFEFAVKEDVLPKNNSERENISHCFWYPVKSLYERLIDSGDHNQAVEGILKESKKPIENEDEKKSVERNVFAFWEAVRKNNQNIGVAVIDIPNNEKNTNIDHQRENILNLFVRLNSGGTKLDGFELLASKLKSFDYRMEKFLDEVIDENKDIQIDQATLIKLLFVLNDNPKKSINNLDSNDVQFDISKKERIQKTLKALKEFLKLSEAYEWFSHGSRSAIPLYFLAYHIFHSQKPIENIFSKHDAKDANFRNMRIWLRLSLLNDVFKPRGKGWQADKTGINKIHGVIQKHKGKDFPKDDLFILYKNELHSFIDKANEGNINSLNDKFIFYLIYKGKERMRINDKDHIHPSSILESKGIDVTEINNIANYQLLHFGVNRSKSDKEFCDWINNPDNVSDKKNYLDLHLIPSDENLWHSEQYNAFLKERTKMLINRINKAVE